MNIALSTGDAPHEFDIMITGGVFICLVAHRLKPAEHHASLRPAPDAQRVGWRVPALTASVSTSSSAILTTGSVVSSPE
ncbi:MAG: hypothetical protein R2839_04535 [Thermomicrobiales bacterium]